MNVTSLGLMAAVTQTLGRAGITDWFIIALTVIALFPVFKYKLNSTWLILGGALLGIGYKVLVK